MKTKSSPRNPGKKKKVSNKTEALPRVSVSHRKMVIFDKDFEKDLRRQALVDTPTHEDNYFFVDATCNGKVIGVFQYRVRKARHGVMLSADGTVVCSKFRKKNIGKRLWIYAIQKTKPTIIEVCTVTAGGNKLVTSMKKKFSNIEWEHL